MTTTQKVAIVVLLWASCAQALFVLVYASRPWWRSRVGRALMIKSSSLCAALWLTLVNTFWIYPYEEQIGVGILALIAFACTYQLAAMLLTPRDRREIR